MKKLYLEGHSVRFGQAVSLELIDAPPVRFYQNLRYARKVVDRFNRLQEFKVADVKGVK